MIAALICFSVGLFMALGLVPVIRRKFQGFDSGARSIHQTHQTPISRFGGLALAASFVLVASIALRMSSVPEREANSLALIFSALAMFLLGLLDDIRPLGARKKLIGQIIVASVAYWAGLRIESFRIPGLGAVVQFGGASFLITVLWIVALTNLINLIDGVDGLAGGIALMLMCLLAYVGLGAELTFAVLCSAGMAGALLGFLRYNFPPAKIYMGDGGAYLLGSLIALLTIQNSQKGTVAAALIAPLFALALPIIAVALAILRRGMKGLPILRPDRTHIHHRLLQSGFSRIKTVLVLYSLSLVFLVLALGVFWSDGRWVPFLFGFMCLTLLFASRCVNFSRDWFAVGRVVVNSIDMRKESRYALALTQWLQLDAERCASLDELWDGFGFMARKLGFARIRLIIENSRFRSWQRESLPSISEDFHRTRLDFNIGNFVAMEFVADPLQMDERRFDLLSELAAEAWITAAGTWQKLDRSSLPSRGLAFEKCEEQAAEQKETYASS